jgi:hypothetical protein
MRWVKLYEKFTEWEWHDVPEMVSLFFHLLVMAQHEDYKYHGKVIKRGQLVTSIRKLAKLTGISFQSVRTCLGRLELTHEITQLSTHRNTLITICNYDVYQSKPSETNTLNDTQTNTPLTQHQTRIKEDNRIIDVVDNTHAREQFFGELFTQQMCMSLHIDTATYKTLADELLNDWEITEEPDPSKKHFLAAMRIKVEAWRKRMAQPTKKTKEQIRAEALAMAQAAAYNRIKDYGINNN